MGRYGNWYAAGFLLPTFFSTTRDKRIAIEFAAGQGGTTKDAAEKSGMIIEFKCNKVGVDVSWISKFMYEREVLLPPFIIAAPDFSRNTILSKVKKGNSAEKVGSTSGDHNSVYATFDDAYRAI